MCAARIGVAEGKPVALKCVRERTRVAGGLGGVDQTVRGDPRLVLEPGDRQCEDQAYPSECVGVATVCELGAAPLDLPFGLPDVQVRRAKHALSTVGHPVAAIAHRHLASVAVADSRLDPLPWHAGSSIVSDFPGRAAS
jgi:hypothetical protein